MSDHINLKRPIDLNEPESTQNLLDVIQAGLGRPGDVSTKAAALADDIRTLGAARRDIGEASEFIEELCGVVVCVAFLLPPGHPWQDTFVQTMQNVQQTDGDYESDEDSLSDEDYESNGDYEQESDEGYASDGDDEQLDEVGILFSLLSCHTNTSQGRIPGLEILTRDGHVHAGLLVWYVFGLHTYKCYEAYIHRSHYSRPLDTRRGVRLGESQLLLCPVQDQYI